MVKKTCECGIGNIGNCREDESEHIGKSVKIINDKEESDEEEITIQFDVDRELIQLKDDFDNLSDTCDELPDGKLKDGMFLLLDKMEKLMKKHF